MPAASALNGTELLPDLFEKADGTLAGQSQRVPASLFKTYLGLFITSYVSNS